MNRRIAFLLLSTCLLSAACTSNKESMPSETIPNKVSSYDPSFDAKLRSSIDSVWRSDPLNRQHSIEVVSEDLSLLAERSAALRSVTSVDPTYEISDRILDVADLMVSVKPSDYSTAEEYSQALDDVIASRSELISEEAVCILHLAAVAASEATFLRYGEDMAYLDSLWSQGGKLRAYEYYGEREANAFALTGEMIRSWWRSHDCARGIISSAIGAGIGALISGGAGLVGGVVGAAVGGALNAC